MTDDHRADAIAYRADVDGLRAVAIVPVVLYHAGLAPFSGGFVGVDVFFVISGFLITSFILAQIKRGTFSFRNFYLRRIRRIFPALFVMMAGSAIVGWCVMTPNDFRLLGESISATVLFASNVLFWLHTGYFAAPLEEHPLLHTWSLGVEEQFYLGFPILMVLLFRYIPRRAIGITLALCIASFALNVLTVADHPRLAFYLAPPRIWELFTGALLAMGALPPPRDKRWSEAGGLLGAAMIVVAIFGFSPSTAFPGFAALMPTIGAAAIIWAGCNAGGMVTRILSHPAPVLIGKISYSLYLWHFPLLAFGAYVAIGGESLGAKLALLALSVLLAFVSWRYIEQPVRKGRWVFGEPQIVFRTAGVAIVLLGGFGLAAHVTGGFPARLGKPALQILASEDDYNSDRRSCLILAELGKPTLPPSCKFGAAGAAPEFAVWGDSHAESLRAAFDAAANKAGRTGVFFGTAGCIPELGVDRPHGGCDGVNELVADYLVSTASIRTIILSGRWGLWADGTAYKNEPGAGARLVLTTASGAVIDNRAGFSAGVERAVAKLRAAGKQVWLVGPIPEIGYNVPRSLYLNSLGVLPAVDIRPTRAEFNARQSAVLPLLARLADQYHAHVVWPHSVLCDDRLCQVAKDGRPIYVDDQHLTRPAALSLSPLFDPIFTATPTKP
ncbi:MAG TPA: acyltransferase family protein [Pseudolabrys sp.]|nr:acyltransferase family protein [Pseudolabrys sp.]